MAKDSFSWKSLFINDSDSQASEKQSQSIPTENTSNNTTQDRFPNSVSAIPPPGLTATPTGVSSENPFLDEVLGVYQKGFESLNSEGFDFFEFYKSVMAVGIGSSQNYQMAFAMGKSIRPELTKEFLLDKAQFYIAEIEKVHKNYDIIGNSRQKELLGAIAAKKDTLSKEVEQLKAEIARLQTELQNKVAELEKIDGANSQDLVMLQQKVDANNMAKQRILETINAVAAGIKQYI